MIKIRLKTAARFLSGLWLAAAVAACSSLPALPTIPPGWTVTPDVSPTIPSTPVPTVPTPTPQISAPASDGDRAFFNGDYDTALLNYQIVLQDSPDEALRAAAKWGEARVYFAKEQYDASITALQALAAEFPASPHLGQSYFLQGLAYYRLGNYPAAADSWQTYLTFRPGYLDALAQEFRGDALFEAGNYAEALSAYTAAIQAPSIGDDINLDIKTAATYTKLGDHQSALALYDGISARTPSDFVKAQAAYESALAYQALGQDDAAQGKFRLSVENYWKSPYAYLSLVTLLDAGIPVSDIDRGLVDYFYGEYAVAIERFDLYIKDNPLHDGTALYYRALSNSALGQNEEALQDYTTFITTYPAHPRWEESWSEKAVLEWADLNRVDEGVRTYLDFVAAAPGSPLAVDALMSAARVLERNGRYDEAIQIWARVGNEYPGDEQSAYAVFLGGMVFFRNGDYFSALDSFNRSLGLSMTDTDRARSYLWLGKAQQKLGNTQDALNAWRVAQEVDPGGYYSERARDLLVDRAPFTPSPALNLNVDLARERADAEAWMRLTFNLPADSDLGGLGALSADERVIRGTELWELGLYERARLEFESLRVELEVNQDAVGSYQLANYLAGLGLYRPAIFAARQVLTMAGLDEHTESMMAPPYFSRLRYGLYYSDLVIPDAQVNALDPLFVFSVIRQESFFEGFISSNAGARGLMQIIPETGQQINYQLVWPRNYTDKDLYRPDVSIAFGTHYLASNRDLLGGNLYATLAAYNGGPGNAAAWKELAGDDPDLFLETVRFEETRNYIRNIYEMYLIYRRLYGAAE